MVKKFVVIGPDGSASWNEKTDDCESFGSFKEAVKRAETLAELEPGEKFSIFQRVASVACPVQAAVLINEK